MSQNNQEQLSASGVSTPSVRVGDFVLCIEGASPTGWGIAGPVTRVTAKRAYYKSSWSSRDIYRELGAIGASDPDKVNVQQMWAAALEAYQATAGSERVAVAAHKAAAEAYRQTGSHLQEVRRARRAVAIAALRGTAEASSGVLTPTRGSRF